MNKKELMKEVRALAARLREEPELVGATVPVSKVVATIYGGDPCLTCDCSTNNLDGSIGLPHALWFKKWARKHGVAVWFTVDAGTTWADRKHGVGYAWKRFRIRLHSNPSCPPCLCPAI